MNLETHPFKSMRWRLRLPCHRGFATAPSRRARLAGYHNPSPALAAGPAAPRGSTSGPNQNAREREHEHRASAPAPAPVDGVPDEARTLGAPDKASTTSAIPIRPLTARSQATYRPATSPAPRPATKQRGPPAAAPQPGVLSAPTSPDERTPPANSVDALPRDTNTDAATAQSSSSSRTGGLTPGQLEQYQLSPRQHQQLELYLDHLLETNQSMNLTAVRDKDDAWLRHVVDSLALLPVIERHAAAGAPARDQPRAVSPTGATASSISGSSSSSLSGNDDGREASEDRARSGEAAGSSVGGGRISGGGRASMGGGEGSVTASLRIVDVGTGAGLPGMVLAVARPQWKVTLLDSLRKRCDFLREAAARAGLRNVEVVWSRAEDGGQRQELRQVYDIAVARAVAESRVLAELCLPFVRVGGLWVAAKGPDPEVEVAAAASAIRQLGGEQLALERVDSHSAEGQRTALVVRKVRSTPAKFPRQAGTPSKKPL